ncbi:hamartin isoform X1 [Diprion similis]|uniref:hamartin isoform X1 n=1 Tax=Diprion similis TaxID=362088 RepID=UPI001EF75FCD|nr:hamartin isoform X1 [Diprion similis]
MGSGAKGVTELFDLLESNKLGAVEEMKKVFHDHFLITKDNWLVNGLFDYYLSTNSLRAVEVLVGVREPHDKHLLDRLAEALTKHTSNGQNQRVQALTLLGHVVRRHPTWLYKLPSHCLFDRLLKLLKADGEILPLMSALLLLVTLLPMLPAYLNPFLNDIFEVFARLASYHHQQSSQASLATSASPSAEMERDRLYILHLQVGLESLFHRLYGMYPCNFVSFLRQHYMQRDSFATFSYTVRPMLDSVRMHPLLVTATKEIETSANRWKKMEHHDVVAECGRFALDKFREDVPMNTGYQPRITHPIIEPPSHSHGLIDGGSSFGLKPVGEEGFWSPSMSMPPNSPPPHETRSTPSTPNNIRIGASPPEAAVEATPETTPVKDLRQLPARAAPTSSAAVRALGSFGNGLSNESRPSTPTTINPSIAGVTSSTSGTMDNISNNTNSHVVLSQKINKLFAERQTSQLGYSQTSASQDFELNNGNLGSIRDTEVYLGQNGSSDDWQEDQENDKLAKQVLQIVGDSQKNIGSIEDIIKETSNTNASFETAMANLSQKVHRLRFYSQCQAPLSHQISHNYNKVRRTTSCPEMKIQNDGILGSIKPFCAQQNDHERSTEEASTQTQDLVPYEHLLLGVVSSRVQESDLANKSNTESCISPNFMLERYIQACARITHSNHNKQTGTTKHKQHQRQKKKGAEDDPSAETVSEDGVDYVIHINLDSGNQLLQLTQMQLQFERQRREVHAERNRRLLGKLRDTQALEEHNTALRDRLRILENETEDLRVELERTKKEARQAEKRHAEIHSQLQLQCAEEQQRSRELNELNGALKLELEEERAKVDQGLRELRAAEAALFDAAHQLKGALKAANQGKLLKCALDTLQRRFLLLGEVQLKLQEQMIGPTPMARQEAAQIQRSYSEELSNLRRQLESRISLIEALRARLIELEGGEAQREALLTEQHQLLQEAKERHEAELEALESKYKAQRAINLHLEERVLELLGTLEDKSSTNACTTNTVSSASPKERSPPLSVSLASSSEGSLAFMQSGGGTGFMMSDCCDPAGEITNLQAIVDPGPSPSHESQAHQQQQPPS